MKSVFDAHDLIAKLGDQSDVVASRLLSLGCVGLPNRSDECPLAIYLRQNGFECMTVSRGYVRQDIIGMGLFSSTPLPPQAYAFTIDFDNGYYPELVR